MTIPWLGISVGGILVVEAFETYLQFRQFVKLSKAKERPEEVKEIVTEEEFKQGLGYQTEKLSFGLLQGGVELPATLLCLLAGLWPILYNYTSSFLPADAGQISKALAFFGAAQVIEEITSLPFSLYHDFVLEEKHGFNNKSLSLFVMDKVKMWGLNLVLVAPLLALAMKLAVWSGPQCYLYLWVFGISAMILMTFITPILIMPLFNKYEPVEDQVLKKKIEDLAASVKYPLTKLYQMDGSKRSNHSNAFMFGFWKNKRIVLFDTLLKQKREEIVAILAHELGHWAKCHMMIGMAAIAIQMFCMLFVFKEIVFRADVFHAFGFAEPNIGIGFFLFGILFTPLSSLTGFLGNLLSRKNEYEADKYAADLGYSKELCEALIHLQKENKSTWESDKMYAWWNYTHPTVLERVRVLRAVDAKIE